MNNEYEPHKHLLIDPYCEVCHAYTLHEITDVNQANIVMWAMCTDCGTVKQIHGD